MIILDTNVVSEMMKPQPSLRVLSWIDQNDTNDLYITTITIAEISYGLQALQDGVRRNTLEDAFNRVINEAFEYRVLSFDQSAAHFYGEFMAQRKKIGKPLSILDGQISAIARSQRMLVATRNIRDFSDCGLDLIDPF